MLFALAVSLTATAQVKVVDLWNNSTAPHSNGVTAAETEKNGGYYNITQTQLYVYAADPAKAIDANFNAHVEFLLFLKTRAGF